MRAKDISRFWAKVNKTDTCWLWAGARNGRGYGTVVRSGKRYYAHRYALLVSGVDIPVGAIVDHKCHTLACVRPEHLRLVTPKQNLENLAGPYRNSTSGVRGVARDSRNEKWAASVVHNKKRYYVGIFAELADAEAAVIAKRNELFTHNDADRHAAALEAAA